MTKPILDIQNLTVTIAGSGDRPHAINDVSFSVGANEIVCVVGESGSGKSVTAQAVMQLLAKGQLAITGGSIKLEGDELTTKSATAMRQVRGKRASMIFQEPMTALNPLHTIGRQIAEPLRLHKGLSLAAARAEALRLPRRSGS